MGSNNCARADMLCSMGLMGSNNCAMAHMAHTTAPFTSTRALASSGLRRPAAARPRGYCDPMQTLVVVLSTLVNTAIIALFVRRLLGTPVGWPRTFVLSAIACLTATPLLLWTFGQLDIQPPQAGSTSGAGVTIAVTTLFVAWLLAIEISVLAVAEAIVPTGSIPGPWEFVRGLPGWLRRTRRYLQILGIAARHGLTRFVSRSRRFRPDTDGPHDTAVALREALSDGGVTFVKLGQMLATRPDLVPPRYVEELSRLHSQVPPEPWDVIAATIGAELGGDPGRLFASIEHEPLAAASVGQVHRARLHTGEDVVVKVQRSSARALVRADLDIVTRLAELTERRASWARRLGTVALAEGFRRSLDEELDYRTEFRNLSVLHGSGLVVLPRGHASCSSRRVLTMDYLDGVPLSHAGDRIAALSPESRRELAEALLDVVLRQVLAEGVFHADLHGGNILLLADDRLALLDFGAVGRMDRGARTSLVLLLLAVNRQDGAAACTALRQLLDAPDDLDTHLLERRMAELIMRVGGAPVDELFNDLFATVVDAGLRVPPHVAAAFRAIGALEGTLRLLTPDLDLVALARTRARGIVGGDLTPQTFADEARERMVAVLPALDRLPAQVASIADRLDRPNLGLSLSLAPDAAGRRFLGGLVNQLVIAVLAATSAACGVAMVLNGGGPLMSPRLPLSTYIGLIMLLFAYIFGSRLVAVVFRRSANSSSAHSGAADTD